jgi:hypothetical protein
MTSIRVLCSAHGLNQKEGHVDEIARLKRENKKLRALLKTAVGLLQESKTILRAKASAKPKKKSAKKS